MDPESLPCKDKEVLAMRQLGAGDGIYLGDGEWLSWEDFGDLDPDEPQALLPVLEWQADVQLHFPRAEMPVIRQFVRLTRAAQEYHETTGRHLNIYGALGELYGVMVWGIRLHRKPDVQGSDGRLGNDWIEIKTIGPRSATDRVTVKLSGNFSKLLVVRIALPDPTDQDTSFRMTSRMADRKVLTAAKSGKAGIAWSRACKIGAPPP
jgi:hypothetical protein